MRRIAVLVVVVILFRRTHQKKSMAIRQISDLQYNLDVSLALLIYQVCCF